MKVKCNFLYLIVMHWHAMKFWRVSQWKYWLKIRSEKRIFINFYPITGKSTIIMVSFNKVRSIYNDSVGTGLKLMVMIMTENNVLVIIFIKIIWHYYRFVGNCRLVLSNKINLICFFQFIFPRVSRVPPYVRLLHLWQGSHPTIWQTSCTWNV